MSSTTSILQDCMVAIDISIPWWTTILMCEYENASMPWVYIYISRFCTTIEGAYNTNTYYIGNYIIVILESWKDSII